MHIDTRHRRQDSIIVTPSQQNTEHWLSRTSEAHDHQQAPKQLGHWLQYHVRRIPAKAVMALVNCFSKKIVSCCVDLLVIFASVLAHRKIYELSETLDVTTTTQITIFTGASVLWNIGASKLWQNFDNYIENIVVQLLDTDDKSAPPHQLLTWVANKTGCQNDEKERLLQEVTRDHLTGTHLRVVLDLFKTILTGEMDNISFVRIKMRNVLFHLSLYPERACTAANLVALYMEQCQDDTLKVLDRFNNWVLADTVFLPLENGKDKSCYDLLFRIQLTYMEWALVETMFTVRYSSWLMPGKDKLLGEHSLPAVIIGIYKRILHQSGACTFLPPPPRVPQSRLYYFFLPGINVFYQFQQVFLQKLHDTPALFQFAKMLMKEKETTLLEHDSQLCMLINKKSTQYTSRLDHLMQQQAQHNISKTQYLERSQRLMERHHQELDKIWLKHISGSFSRMPERLKKIGGCRKVPANLSLIKLLSKYS